MRVLFGLSSALVTSLILAAPAFAQKPGTAPPQTPMAGAPQTPGANRLSRADMEFVKKAAEGGLAEVEFGKVAEQNAQDPQVKQFGSRMVKDHTAANDQLKSILSGMGVPAPDQLNQRDAQMRDRLARLTGAQFDRDYMRMMVNDHNKDIKEFRHEAETGQDPQIKAFAQQTLKVIEDHDRLAHEVDRALTATGSSQPRR